MISKDRVYKTRDGREVRIYATDGGGDYPVHGASKDSDGWEFRTWTQDGKFQQHEGGVSDLIEVKPRIKRTVWLCVYKDRGIVTHYISKPTHLSPDVVACVPVEIDCEEGHGL